MPFKNNAQRKLCFSLKSRGKAGSWDCKKWQSETKSKHLPNKVKPKKR